MRVFEAVAEEIHRQGVGRVFTLMSQETTKLTSELDRRGVRVYHARHEHVAVGMADGYARATGEVGVAIVGMGPGLTNSMNALLTASKARSPVLVIAGETAEVEGATHAQAKQARLVNKYIDQPALFDTLGIVHVDLRSEASVVPQLRSAFASVRDRARLIAVDLPFQLLEGEAGSVSAPASGTGAPPPISHTDVANVCDLLEASFAAKHPIIVAGRGAARSSARDELVRLGRITGALLGTSVMGKGLFAEEPYDVGVIGTFATPVASELLRQADVVLAFGASLNQHTTFFGEIFGKARIVQIDSDRLALRRHTDADIAIHADARDAATAIANELERRGHQAEGYRTPDIAARLAAVTHEPFTDRTGSEGIDPRSLMIGLDRVLPRPRTIVIDAGNHMAFPIRYLSVEDDAGFVWPMEYSAVGCSLGVALGVALARPDRHVVLFIGDGGMMMTLADLDTAVRYRIPIVIVVSNDSAFGAELHYLREQGYDDAQTRYANPRFADVARALGLEAITVASLAELPKVKDRLVRTDVPLLLDCRVTAEVYGDFHTSLQ